MSQNDENVIDFKLDNHMSQNSINYFFTTFYGRDELANKIMKETLEKKYNQKFEPIYVLQTIIKELPKNYIIINRELKGTKLKNYILMRDPEDLVADFSISPFIKNLIKKLSKKQERIFCYFFTTSFFSLKHPKIKVIGPNPKLTTYLDSKKVQFNIFEELNLPHPNFNIFNNLNQVIKYKNSNKIIVYSNYNSGGYHSQIINEKIDFEKFAEKIIENKKEGPFISVEFLDDVLLSPNVNAIITETKIKVLNITDQILDGNKYLGNIFPSIASENVNNKIVEITNKIGIYLQKLGFRGIFGCDFIVDDKENVFIVDLNPRRQGGYSILCALDNNLVRKELEIHIENQDLEISNINYNPNFSWAQLKIFPENYLKKFEQSSIKYINENFLNNDEGFISFYPKKSIIKSPDPIGHYILRTNNLNETKNKLKNLNLN